MQGQLRKWVIWGLVAAVAAVAVPGLSLAAGSQGDGSAAAVDPTTVAPQGPMWQALGLTDEQVQKINDIRQQGDEAVLPLQQQLVTKRQELALGLRATNPDQAKVKALNKEIQSLQAQISDVRIETELALRAVLTEEQRAKLGAFGGHGFGAGGRGAGMGMCEPGGAGRGMRGGMHGGPSGSMGGPGPHW